MNRVEVKEEEVHAAMQMLIRAMSDRLDEKGYGTFASRHEILGIIEEERYELLKAVHENVPDEEVMDELLDIAVGAVFGCACIMSGKTDW